MKKYLILTSIIFLLFPSVSFASQIYITSIKNIALGEEFLATVSFDADYSINAIEGKIIFPGKMLEVKEIRDGNSSINFWIEKPTLVSPGFISFSGITPGGFRGKGNNIFSLLFKAKTPGFGSINFSDVHILLNDGNGTSDTVITTDKDFSVVDSGKLQKNLNLPKDTELPESFQPELNRNPFLFEGRWFVAFATVDKSSGIERYEVREARQKLFAFLEEYEISTSPHVLKDQELHSFIFIKAVDNIGNERVEQIRPRYPLPWYENSSDWITIVILLLLLLVVTKKWKKFTQQS